MLGVLGKSLSLTTRRLNLLYEGRDALTAAMSAASLADLSASGSFPSSVILGRTSRTRIGVPFSALSS